MSRHRQRFLALRAFLYCALGFALTGGVFWLVFTSVGSLIYRIVLVFLALIFLSNYTAKVVVSYYHQRKDAW